MDILVKEKILDNRKMEINSLEMDNGKTPSNTHSDLVGQSETATAVLKLPAVSKTERIKHSMNTTSQNELTQPEYTDVESADRAESAGHSKIPISIRPTGGFSEQINAFMNNSQTPSTSTNNPIKLQCKNAIGSFKSKIPTKRRKNSQLRKKSVTCHVTSRSAKAQCQFFPKRCHTGRRCGYDNQPKCSSSKQSLNSTTTQSTVSIGLIESVTETSLSGRVASESIHDFKKQIKEALDLCLGTFINNLKVEQSHPGYGELSLNLEETKYKLEMKQTQLLDELYVRLENVYALSCSRKSQSLEIQKQKPTLETMKSNKFPEDQSESMMEPMALERIHREANDGKIMTDELLGRMQMLEIQFEKFIGIQEFVKELATCQRENFRLHSDLDICKESINILIRQLEQTDQVNCQAQDEKQDIAHNLKFVQKTFHELDTRDKSECTHQEIFKQVKLLVSALHNIQLDSRTLRNQMEEINAKFGSRIRNMENQLHEAQDYATELQAVIIEVSDEKFDSSQEIQYEFKKLQEADEQKRREIESLKLELSKSKHLMKSMQEKTHRNQELHDVRNSLINSLRTPHGFQSEHLEEHLSERRRSVDELGGEVSTKLMEIQKLRRTLSNNEVELSRQSHLIQLFEESNERCQILRVRQEERTGRLEEQITQLKRTIRVYADRFGNSFEYCDSKNLSTST